MAMTTNGKDKWVGLSTHQYSFSGYGGVQNCTECDDFTQTNEYDRRDGAVVWFCNPCSDRMKL
jgi:hypothetical protein